MSLLKEMIFNVRRAVYTLASFLSSKNDKKQAGLLPPKMHPFCLQPESVSRCRRPDAA